MGDVPVERIEACNNCGARDAEVTSRSRDFEYDTCSNEFTFVRCRACQLIYLRDRPVVAALGIIYPSSYQPYEFDEILSPLVTRARNLVQGRKVAPVAARAPADALVVDVGCGGGAFLRILKRLGPPGWRLIGVDFAEDAIRSLAKAGIEGRQGRFESMDWDLPPPDVVVMNQVIEHLDDPAAVVGRAFALLKPGGILMLETPSVDAWDARLFWKRHWGGWHTPRHWTLYTPATLTALLRRSGFEVVETKALLSPTFWLQSVHHWLLDRPRLRRLAPFFDITHIAPLCLTTGLDLFQLGLTGKTSNFRIVAMKPT